MAGIISLYRLGTIISVDIIYTQGTLHKGGRIEIVMGFLKDVGRVARRVQCRGCRDVFLTRFMC